MPAATNRSLAAAEDPASPASAERSILRRWANAASMTANTCSPVAVVADPFGNPLSILDLSKGRYDPDGILAPGQGIFTRPGPQPRSA